MDESAQRKRARLAELEVETARLRAELQGEARGIAPESTVREGEGATPLRQGLSKREVLLVEAERVAHLGSFAWDLRTGEIGWSDEFYRILGLDPARVQPSSEGFFEAIHEEDRARVQELARVSLTMDEMIPCEFRVVRPSGELREVQLEGALMHDASGRQLHVVGTVLDVTDQRRSARLLAGMVAELNEAQHIAGLASWRWDAFSSQLEWSAGMFRLLGLADSAVASEDLFYAHIHPDDQELVRQHRDQVAVVSDSEPLEFRIVQSDGKILEVAQHAVAQWDAGGVLLGFRGVIQDITDRKALEEQLRHSQKMEAVGTLAGGVAHDFNNYLMVIAGYTELLSEQLGADDPARESVQAIGEAYQRCAHLTQQLLTLSRKRKALPVTIDLSVLVAELAPLIRSVLGETMQLRLALESAGTLIIADPLQVEQALMNLVVNARDAMSKGGELVVRVVPRIEPLTERPLVRLSVIDVGCGIPHELRSRIFEPFFTTKQVGQGTGLGLSTVYAIVRDAGARIELDSEPGRGTTFHIDWPSCDAPLTTTRKTLPPRDNERTGAGTTILLVEDVVRVRELLAQQLERAGYRVCSAPNGQIALECLAQEHVDLVLSDVIMPQLGGIELVRQVRQRYPKVRYLLMTGYSPEGVQGSDPSLGEPLLRKPFTTVELLKAVRRALGAASS